MEVIHKIGRRKTAVARIYVSEGSGTITVNKRNLEEYFPTASLQYKVKQPFILTHTENNYDVKVNVYGGGITGQAEAIRLAIARALREEYEKEERDEQEEEGAEGRDSIVKILKKEGLFTRNPRMVERKKYGQKKARKKFQFSKR